MEINCNFMNNACIVEDVNISQPGQVIAAFRGEYPTGMSKKDIKHLIFWNVPNLQHFPRDLQKHFPNLESLTITESGIKQISKEDLRGLQNLEAFGMMRGKLKSLSEDLFTDMPDLTVVYFENNEIELTSSKVLEPFRGLICLVNLLHNTNIDAAYSSHKVEDAKYTKSLEELIKIIDEKCIKP